MVWIRWQHRNLFDKPHRELIFMKYKSAAFIIIFTIAAITSGCLGPSYETRKKYNPPNDPSARSCLMQCQESQMQCNSICQKENNLCTIQANQVAQERFIQDQNTYNQQLRQWDTNQRHYISRQNECLQYKFNNCQIERNRIASGPSSNPATTHYNAQRYHNECVRLSKDACRLHYNELSANNPKPDAPTKQDTSSSCNSDCNCKSQYDTCFQSCGGIITNETVCVSNCEKIQQ